MDKNYSMSLPNAVSNDVIVQELGNETLVYNLKTHQAKCLNETLSVIWQLCDGNNDVSSIRQITEKKLKTKVTEDVILLALDELQKNQLLKTQPETSPIGSLSKTTRREMIRKVGLTSLVAIPIITSVIVPQAAHAGSAGCSDNNQCQSSCCINNVCTDFNAGGLTDGSTCFSDSECQSNCCDFNVCAPACGSCYIT